MEGIYRGEEEQTRVETSDPSSFDNRNSNTPQRISRERERIDRIQNPLITPAVEVDYSTQEPKVSKGDDKSSDPQTSQEVLLRAIYDKLPSDETLSGLSKQELDILYVIADRLKRIEETKIEFIWNAVLQLAGLLFVVIFGVFAALAYNAAGVANKQSAEANQMSLLTFCMLNPNTADGICSAVSQQGSQSLSSLASVILGSTVTAITTPSSSSSPSSSTVSSGSTLSTSNSSPTPSSTTESATSSMTQTSSTPTSVPESVKSSEGLSKPAIAGIGVGVALGLVSIMVSLFIFWTKFSRGPPTYHTRGSPN